MSDSKIVINPETQIATLYIKEDYIGWDSWRKVNSYLVSMGKRSNEILGNEDEDGISPCGLHEIVEKIGEEEKEGTVFIGRRPVPYIGENRFIRKILKNEFIRGLLPSKVWTSDPKNPLNKGKMKDRGFVLTRILRIKGLEDRNSATYDKNIYLHATRNLHKLGKPNTRGCIAFSSKDIIDVFNQVSVGTKVYIEDKLYNEDKAKKAQLELK